MRNNILFYLAVFAISTISLAGCGGGGGGAAPAGTTVSRGVVTAEGNIAVNGLFYNISSATIIIDGLPSTKSDLKVGMIVTVKGIFDNRTSHAIRRMATGVEYASDFQGPVDCVNPLSNSLTIMGQQVLLASASPNRTVFANFTSNQNIFASISTAGKLNPHLSPHLLDPTRIADPDPASITYNPYVYSTVKVSGFSNGINYFLATRIELLDQNVDLTTSVPVGIRGEISNVDLPGMTFTIGNLTVDYSMMNQVYVPTQLVEGFFVSVMGSSSDFEAGNAPSLAIIAPQLIKPITEGVTAKEGDHVTVAGFVSGLSGSFFRIGGTPVDASVFSLSGISNAGFLEVDGIFHNGILVASKITLF
ncbi:MAG TPA: DUF5666 domain-containing protein [Geobacteraceae bacterium]